MLNVFFQHRYDASSWRRRSAEPSTTWSKVASSFRCSAPALERRATVAEQEVGEIQQVRAQVFEDATPVLAPGAAHVAGRAVAVEEAGVVQPARPRPRCSHWRELDDQRLEPVVVRGVPDGLVRLRQLSRAPRLPAASRRAAVSRPARAFPGRRKYRSSGSFSRSGTASTTASYASVGHASAAANVASALIGSTVATHRSPSTAWRLRPRFPSPTSRYLTTARSAYHARRRLPRDLVADAPLEVVELLLHLRR